MIVTGAGIIGRLGVPYLMGGNTIANAGKVLLHAFWGGEIAHNAARIVVPQAGDVDTTTKISFLAYQIFFCGLTIVAYRAMSPQLSMVRCTLGFLGSLCINAVAQLGLGPDSEGMLPERLSDRPGAALTVQATWILSFSALVAGIVHAGFWVFSGKK